MADEVATLLADLQWSATAPDGSPCCPACRAPRGAGDHARDCRLARMMAKPQTIGAGPRWRHRKRGTTYVQVGLAVLQHSGGVLADQDVMMVYRAEADDALGVRPLLEFSDGRFERL